jgi:Transposase DDE domain
MKIKKSVRIKISRAKHSAATRFGGSAILVQYLGEVLNFRQRFSTVKIKKGKNSTFTSVDMLFALLAITMLGCDRLFHINAQFRDEEMLAKQLGIARIFDQSTAHRFLLKFNQWNINQLEQVLNRLIEEQGRFEQTLLGRNVLDIDASDLTRSSHHTEGAKPGRNKKNKGKDSYLISCGYAGKQVVATHLTSGNIHCSQPMEAVFQQALTVMKRIDLVRMDAGYCGAVVLTWLLTQTVSLTSTKKVKFLIGCNGQANGVKEAKKYAQKHPEKWVEVKKNIWVMDFKNTQVFDKLETGIARLVLVKMKQEIKKCKNKKVRYHVQTRIYGIITNLTRGYSAVKIFKKYHQRQTIELMFRELKNAFSVGKLPSGRMKANYAYFLMCCLAYNCSYYFKRDVLPKEHQHHSMTTIRRMFLVFPANYRHIWKVELNSTYRYLKSYEKMAQNVYTLIQVITTRKSKC